MLSMPAGGGGVSNLTSSRRRTACSFMNVCHLQRNLLCGNVNQLPNGVLDEIILQLFLAGMKTLTEHVLMIETQNNKQKPYKWTHMTT